MSNMFEVGQVFTDNYPPEAAKWCNNNNATIIEVDDGYQIVAIPEPSTEELKSHLRTERDRRITACDWVISRHAEQVSLDATPTLTADKYTAWLDYRQDLRDIPSLDGFPWDGGGELTPWPEEPAAS